MALTNCTECKAEVSDQAAKCPKCGFVLRKAVRSFFGKVCKWSFIIFNVLMLIWIITGVGGAANHASQIQGESARAGAAIGTGIGIMLILALWVMGDIILGLLVLFTRPKVG